MTDAVVTALWRHPVKGFTPEPLAEARLQAGGWFPGDRMYAVEDGPTGFDPAAPTQLPKTRFTVLMRDPSLARVRTRWDEPTDVMTVQADGHPDLAVRLSDPDDRTRFDAWLTDFLGDAVDGPLRIIPAGDRHRFMDSRNGFASVLNLASVRDLEARIDRPLDPLRFRANIWVEGLEPWVENGWSGRHITVGGVALKGVKPITRCAATHANPETGERDIDVCASLFEQYGHVLCGLYVSIGTAGRIAVGDPLEIRP
ncbi:MOSC domain-containing protein [Brevundimonas sp. Root1423]|uniref:MOSC domain-containing protein n=1 Tax=Brevundimonas sp. Root1423 TaxID=1736462 RepID=UPI0006FF185E|nr:MOSC N-terminal beta barrel domain-containing protein [Brevundimonas sp. Root1423]KQY89535.1 molybdenum cofactor sulfurase [Brevundimonas sp. Root1423]